VRLAIKSFLNVIVTPLTCVQTHVRAAMVHQTVTLSSLGYLLNNCSDNTDPKWETAVLELEKCRWGNRCFTDRDVAEG
jgi:hypothetical protein